MKLLLIVAAAALPILGQSPAPVPAGAIIATIAPQGTDAIQQVAGVKPKAASLVRIDICNEDADSDHNVSSSRVISAIELKEQVSIYGSDVVIAVLNVLQQKDTFTRAQKIIGAGGNTIVLLSALFRTVSPLTATVVNAGPQIASAILPAVSDPRDLPALGQKLLQDNTPLALGRLGSGNDCRTGISVAALGVPLKIDKVSIQ